MGSALEARAYFLLLRQKKVAKEKATPGSVPAAPVPCATQCWRGLRNSGLRPSDSPRPFPPAPALLGTSQGARKASRLDCCAVIVACCGRRRKKGKNRICRGLGLSDKNRGLSAIVCLRQHEPLSQIQVHTIGLELRGRAVEFSGAVFPITARPERLGENCSLRPAFVGQAGLAPNTRLALFGAKSCLRLRQ